MFWSFPVLTIIVFAAMFIVGMWGIHLSMNAGKPYPHKWSSFKRFLAAYKTREWVASIVFKGSLFGKDRDSFPRDYIHAGIVTVDGVCYNLYPWSYYIFCIWKIRECRRKRAVDETEESAFNMFD
jgi:hypothetical protein